MVTGRFANCQRVRGYTGVLVRLKMLCLDKKVGGHAHLLPLCYVGEVCKGMFGEVCKGTLMRHARVHWCGRVHWWGVQGWGVQGTLMRCENVHRKCNKKRYANCRQLLCPSDLESYEVHPPMRTYGKCFAERNNKLERLSLFLAISTKIYNHKVTRKFYTLLFSRKRLY